jgi:hypothetical protein
VKRGEWKTGRREALFGMQAHEEWACRETRKRRGAEPGSMRSQGYGTPFVR